MHPQKGQKEAFYHEAELKQNLSTFDALRP
jgi:hypothetical protein